MKVLVAVGLLPLVLAVTRALGRVLWASGADDRFWMASLAGGASWATVYLLLPRPMRLYVLGHELTHALCAWAMGGSVKSIRVGSSGGHVVTTRSNFVVVLAPYFLPLYALLVAGVFGVGNRFWDWWGVAPLFHWLLGVAYGFHLTMTGHVLRGRQPDLVSQGYLFSAFIIWLGNAATLLVAISLLAQGLSLGVAVGWTWDELTRMGGGLAGGYWR